MGVKLVIGVPGAGKTLALHDMVHDACLDGWLCLAVDKAGEWGESFEGRPNPFWRGAPPKILQVDDFEGDVYEELASLRDEGRGCVVVFPYPWEPLEVAQLGVDVGDCIYVDDEIDYVAVYEGWKNNPLYHFVHRGRHMPDAQGDVRQLHVYGAMRRPQSVHTDLTSMAEEVLIFRVAGKNTLKRVEDEGWVSPEGLQLARTQKNLSYFLWRFDGTITNGRLKPAKF